ncbi:MAG TPA: substrate-binding domain-containing protein [Vicinamibacterales bacterium]|nr:substrate-binding domain-containing protein [Vicinamibacterales bacterium]
MRHPFSLRIAGMLAMLAAAAACGGGAPRPREEPTRIAFLFDTLKQERWQRDRDVFLEVLKGRGVEILVDAAEGDADLQAKQAQAMFDKGVKVLVIVPHDAVRAGEIAKAAKARKVPVISYDRLIRDADIDLYVSFDNVRVGELQASYLTSRAPEGNYVLIGGAPTDYNAHQLREGQMSVLKPFVDRKAIRIVSSEWATDWRADEARKITEAALKKTRNRLAAVVASNDVTAGGAIEALEAAGVAGKVLVSGQDADLAAVRRIVAGTQAMTVYKPVRALARLAAAAALNMTKGETPPTSTTVNNGFEDVPAMLVDPIPVDKDGIEPVLIRDGFHTREEVYGAAK